MSGRSIQHVACFSQTAIPLDYFDILVIFGALFEELSKAQLSPFATISAEVPLFPHYQPRFSIKPWVMKRPLSNDYSLWVLIVICCVFFYSAPRKSEELKEKHSYYWGTRQQMLFGKVICDWLACLHGKSPEEAMDPIFGTLLNPTGGG